MDYYDSCMNLQYKEALGGQPLLDLLDRIGGWRLIDNPFSEEEGNATSLNQTGIMDMDE